MSAATELRTTGDRQAPSNLSTSSDSHQEHKETLDLQVEAGRAPSQVDGCSPLMPPVTLGGALIYLVSFGLLNTWGTFQARYSQHELAPHSVDAVAWIGSVQLFLLFLCGMVVGPATDTFGPKWLLTAGAILHVLSMVLTSGCTKYFMFLLIQGFLFGLANSLLFYPTIWIVNKRFPKKSKGLVLGLVVSASSLGGIIWPQVLNALFDRVGFGWSLRIIALISLVCLVVGITCINAGPSIPSSKSHGRPASQSQNRPAVAEPFSSSKSPIFREKPYVLLFVAQTFIMGGSFVPLLLFPQLGLDIGMTFAHANNLVTYANAGSLVGRVGAGIAADHIGSLTASTFCSLFTGVVALAVPAVKTPAGLYIIAPLFGFFSGGLVSLQSACVAATSKTMLDKIGLRIGVLMSVASILVLITTPLAGLMAQHVGLKTGYFAGSLCVAGAAFLAVSRWFISPSIRQPA
ncbi:hypothetical protein EX895_004477 [Sporisorium graminicola]|uniref:Major facilitator superfamily (MFS) profile domain-containing protein n=1 Tax=Sporisorium graminicola TaxID=280036 RepID=A0A4U7KS17_9BASI|nr:hypothetical protein EX895_004477 [Sporisorium graminicola]TKY86836.1 hypothetical protein EX895_004477 [Sporisorium graminicola]